MNTNYLFYWKPKTVEQNKGILLDHVASNQYGTVKRGDIIWIVTLLPGGPFVLVGRVRVDEITDQAEAERRLRGRNIWPATYHIFSKKEEAEHLREIDLSDIAQDLRFVGENERLILSNGRVNPKQLQSKRILTPESSHLLFSMWKPETRNDWTERECYFAVWAYDQLDCDSTLVKTSLYSELANIIPRSQKAIEWKIQNVSACDPRPRAEKPIAEAPNKQNLLKKVFDRYWADRKKGRELYPYFYQGAQFNKPSGINNLSIPEEAFIEEGVPGTRESNWRTRSIKLLKEGRKYFKSLETDGNLRCYACGFKKPKEIDPEIVQLHHTTPLSEAGTKGRAIFIKDALKLLLPLCPTCHRIAHTSSPPLILEDIKALLGIYIHIKA